MYISVTRERYLAGAECIPGLSRMLGDEFRQYRRQGAGPKNLFRIARTQLNLAITAADARAMGHGHKSAAGLGISSKERELFEFSPDEELTFDDVPGKDVHPDDREMVLRESVNQSIENQSFLRVEYRIRKTSRGDQMDLGIRPPLLVRNETPGS